MTASEDSTLHQPAGMIGKEMMVENGGGSGGFNMGKHKSLRVLHYSRSKGYREVVVQAS